MTPGVVVMATGMAAGMVMAMVTVAAIDLDAVSTGASAVTTQSWQRCRCLRWRLAQLGLGREGLAVIKITTIRPSVLITPMTATVASAGPPA